MTSFITHLREGWVYLLLPVAVVVGYRLEKWSDNKLSLFKNKSRQFQRELKPNEDAWK